MIKLPSRINLLLGLSTVLLLVVVGSPAAAGNPSAAGWEGVDVCHGTAHGLDCSAENPATDHNIAIPVSYFYDYIHQVPLSTTLHPGELFVFYDQTGGCGPEFRDIAACEADCTGRVRAYNHDCLSESGPGTYGPWVKSGCSTATEYGYTVECCILSDEPGEVIFSGVVDASKRLGPKWIKTLSTPLVTGDYTFVLDWEGDASLRMSIKDKTTGAQIGANTGKDRPKTLTVQLDAGTEYKIAVWAKHGVGDFQLTMSPPFGDRILAGSVDAARVSAPKWTKTIYIPTVTGDHQFVLDWDGGAKLRISVREHTTGRWVGKNVTAEHPKSVTAHLEAGIEYKIAVWAKVGSAHYSVAVYPPSG